MIRVGVKYKYKYIFLKESNINIYYIFIQIQIHNTKINTLNIKSYFKSYDHILYKIIILIHIPDYIVIN